MNNPTFNPLQAVVIIQGINKPITARFVGKSDRSYIFERIRQDGRQYKKGNLINIQDFHFGSEKMMGKMVIVID